MAESFHAAVRELVHSTSDPAYSVDQRGYVSGWNGGAEILLGYSKAEVVGQPCHKILRGKDVFGNPYCVPDCPILLLARRREPLHHFQMDAYAADGSVHRLLCFAVVMSDPDSRKFSLIHLLRPLNRPLWPWAEREEDHHQPTLTQRELKVLRLLADGHSTRHMAETLSVTASTVRKHVQNILHKLNVRSRLSAVLVAIEKRLL